MQLLDGKNLAQEIISDLRIKVEVLSSRPNLHVILVGNDPSSLKYVSLKEEKCHQVGINFVLHHLSSQTSQEQLLELVNKLNDDPLVTGYFIQLPLPSSVDQVQVCAAINPLKDVDGLCPASPFVPAVDQGIITLLEKYHLSFIGKKIVIVNDSQLIGQPLKKVFVNKGATVILCNQLTANLSSVTSTADILISATGVKNLITNEFVKSGAVVVDVANGDVDFNDVSPQTSFITPTFGGVGPMTIASLISNLVKISQNDKYLSRIRN